MDILKQIYEELKKWSVGRMLIVFSFVYLFFKNTEHIISSWEQFFCLITIGIGLEIFQLSFGVFIDTLRAALEDKSTSAHYKYLLWLVISSLGAFAGIKIIWWIISIAFQLK